VFGNLGYAFGELYRGVNIAAQVKILQQFVPSLRVSDVTRLLDIAATVYMLLPSGMFYHFLLFHIVAADTRHCPVVMFNCFHDLDVKRKQINLNF
jgi:hypothetical protein